MRPVEMIETGPTFMNNPLGYVIFHYLSYFV